MQILNLKPSHKAVKAYYQQINKLGQLSLFNEGAVAPAFAGLLQHCARQFQWTLAEQYSLKRGDRLLRLDGALLDGYKLVHGVWEAKPASAGLEQEIKKKFQAGYPRDNILFQAPDRAILWQDGRQMLDEDISRPEALVETLKFFFEYRPPAYEQWEQAVDEFKGKVPELAAGLLALIRQEERTNRRFQDALAGQVTTVSLETVKIVQGLPPKYDTARR